MGNIKVTESEEHTELNIPGVKVRTVAADDLVTPIPDAFEDLPTPPKNHKPIPPTEQPSRDYHNYIIEQFEIQGYTDLDPRAQTIDLAQVFPPGVVAQYNLDLRHYTPHEIFFAEFYVATLNHKQAARRVGISLGEARAMTNDIHIKNLISARLRFSMMDVEELLARVVRIARFDIGSYIEVAEDDDADRPPRRNGNSSVSLDWSSLIDSGDTFAIKKFSRNKYGLQVEPYDKIRALELVAKVLQLFKPDETTQNINVTHTHQQQLRVEELRELSDDELTSLANNLALANRAASSSGVGEMEAKPEHREAIPARVDDVTPSPSSVG